MLLAEAQFKNAKAGDAANTINVLRARANADPVTGADVDIDSPDLEVGPLGCPPVEHHGHGNGLTAANGVRRLGAEPERAGGSASGQPFVGSWHAMRAGGRVDCVNPASTANDGVQVAKRAAQAGIGSRGRTE